ncbi:MAG: hypothetical protein ACYDH6_19785 [Acidimicrobiales bacterium]
MKLLIMSLPMAARLIARRERHVRRLGRLAAPVSASIVAAGFLVPSVAGPAAAATSVTFGCTGAPQSYTVPVGVGAVRITMGGAAGGGNTSPLGGGAEVSGVAVVAGGSALSVGVGCRGTDGGTGGFGGAGGNGGGIIFSDQGGGGGGGRTVVILAGATGPAMIAGGGGGHGGPGCAYPNSPGGSGGLVGTPGGPVYTPVPSGSCVTSGGGAATQIAPGGGGSPYGSAGFSPPTGAGGAGVRGGGGGGGGFYGGGGGDLGGGGGGGSSYADSTTIVGATFHTGTNAGDGYVIITPSAVPLPVQQVLLPNGNPSTNCRANGGQRVVDNTADGVNTLIYTAMPSAQEVDVCVRADNGTSGVGGEAVITPTVPSLSGGGVTPPGLSGLGPPSTSPGTASACWSTTSPSNQVPTSHPMDQGGVGPVSYTFDTYLNNSVAWVCAQVGSTVNEQVIVPIPALTPPGVTPPSGVSSGYDVTWYPDPGTP